MKNTIIDEFKRQLPCEWSPTSEQLEVLGQLCKYAAENNYLINGHFDTFFIEAVNNKLALNRNAYQHILDEAFLEKIPLNYLLKTDIKAYLDSADSIGFNSLLSANNIMTDSMVRAFQPVPHQVTIQAINDLINTDALYEDVLCSIFSRYCFNLFPKQCTYGFFSGINNTSDDYYKFLGAMYPDIGTRDNALGIIDIPESYFSKGYDAGCNRILNEIYEMYLSLNNHCDLIIYIPPIKTSTEDYQWRLYADCVLFAEKHKKERIDKAYFRWKKIGAQTVEYINQVIPYNAEFDYAFQGFVFKDCFVVEDGHAPYSLMLVFEKNVRDERLINCPACRTNNIQGNSYPILNVRSWECENPLCPDRSKYNRGKRYAFMSLFRQKEMMNDANIIPLSSISKWHLDCQKETTKDEALVMAVRHYSCVGDTIRVVSDCGCAIDVADRLIEQSNFHPAPKTNLLSNFQKSSYFYRYIQYNDRKLKESVFWQQHKAKIYNGDALDVLRGFPDELFDGAVTSPPYYNAKSYSQWPNIYCYLYDMYNINMEVFRTMKEGGIYLFNIFDYFDNENNIVLSAMGNKRMILGAYMIDIFERIGFTVQGNIIWNKGEIQGNRSFNQGNLTPYYQAPLNCWEHIFILSKGKPSPKFSLLCSAIKDIRPVIKIVRGKNVLGHDAPYPKDIPNLLLRYMDEQDIVLDPFLGSGTTCIAANEKNISSVGIEKSEKYFQLCKTLMDGIQLRVGAI